MLPDEYINCSCSQWNYDMMLKYQSRAFWTARRRNAMGYLLGVQHSSVTELILYFFSVRGKGSHKGQSVFKWHYLHVHRLFLPLMMLTAGVKDPRLLHSSWLSTNRLVSELSPMIQIHRHTITCLKPKTFPSEGINSPLFTSLCQKLLIWHSKCSAGGK